MCDHCKTYKPLLDGKSPEYEKNQTRVAGVTSAAADTGCCSWRQTCCGGGCCSQVGNCCSVEPEGQKLSPEKASVGYGYGYSPPQTRMGTVEMTGIPFGMTGRSPPMEMVPCARKQEKIPMCEGGDCEESKSCENSNRTKSENDVSHPTPGQSDR